jgi:hypothetical protein
MDPYSGLVDMLEAKGLLAKVGNKLSYVSPVTGEEIKEFRKGWTGEKLQVIIDEWDMNPEAEAIDVGDIDAADLNEHEGDLENES